jgi:pyridoxal phosphate enzyme (YggS family)
MAVEHEIGLRLRELQERIAAAAEHAGRIPAEIALCAVSKTHPPAAIRAAYAAGQRLFGENYAQELRDKAAELGDLDGLVWHFIGPLQRNKVKHVVGAVACVQSVDSLKLMDELASRAAAAGITLPCLVEVNVADERTKSGVLPAELPALLDAFASRPSLHCEGLMAIPPYTPDPAASRPVFRALRELRDREAARARPHVSLRQLSMGMSHDFAIAIAEGATLVRVGTAIFGARG